MSKTGVTSNGDYVYPSVEDFVRSYPQKVNEFAINRNLFKEGGLVYAEGLEFVRISDGFSHLKNRHAALDFVADLEHYGVGYAIYKRG